MKYQCLVIDDDELIAKSTAEYFNMFEVKTAYVNDYEGAVSFLVENEVSLLLLDINLGKHSGFELCKNIRREYNMPILFISARTSDDDVLTALNIGGDDYIKKPYTLNILLAKVKAILKRYEASTEAQGSQDTLEEKTMGETRIPIAYGLSLDTDAMKIVDDKRSIPLKSMEYKILHYLLCNRNRVVTKDEFFDRVWEEQYIGEGALAVHIRHLREKIEKNPNNPAVIKTVWGVGYIIEEYEEL